jgi:restriction endonuclease S subunit
MEKLRLYELRDKNQQKIEELREVERRLHEEYEIKRRDELEKEREREELHRMERLRINQIAEEQEAERIRLIKLANAEAERLNA